MNPQLVGGSRFLPFYEIGCTMNWIAHQGVRLIGRAAYLKCTQSRIPAVLPFGYRISCTYAPRYFEGAHTGDDPTAYPSILKISSFLFIFWFFLQLIGKVDFSLPELIKNTKRKSETVFPVFLNAVSPANTNTIRRWFEDRQQGLVDWERQILKF